MFFVFYKGMVNKKIRFWAGAALVSAEVITNMALFAAIFSGFIFLIRPAMRKHKKTDLSVFRLNKSAY